MESVSLKEYIDAMLSDLRAGIEQARITIDKRLDSMNAFRDALKDQSQQYPTRAEVDARLASIDKSIRMLETAQAIVDSKAAAWLVWVGLFFTGASFFFSLIGLVISLYIVFIKK